jgi:restriction endonuclease S subunit
MEKVLGEVADIQFGVYEKPVESGDSIYLQVKDFDNNGQITQVPTAFLKLTDKSEKHLLKDGDIVLVAKGFRNFAWTYKDSLGKAIASSIFFVIRVNGSKILPEYLTTLFNSHSYQQLFQQLGAGSSIPSIRKSELEALKIHLPPMELQKRIVDIGELHLKDMQITARLIDEKQKCYNSIINQLITREVCLK